MKDIQLQTCQDVSKRKQDIIKWDKLTAEEIPQYKLRTTMVLSQVLLDHGVILCANPHCTDVAHDSAVDHMYNSTVNALIEANYVVNLNLVSRLL